MAGFQTVGNLVEQVMILVQDEGGDAATTRYDDRSVLIAVNEGMLETQRLRPDFFRGPPHWGEAPQYGDFCDTLVYPRQYVPALVNFVAGRVQLRDNEETTDQRSALLIGSFFAKLLTGQA